MGPKITGAPNAVGYWGGDPHGRLLADQTPEKVLALNYDKIRTLGLPLSLWMEVPDIGVNGVTLCSCVSTTAKQADIPCLSCYGVGRIPGFQKFGTRQYWVSSTDSWATLTNVELKTDFSPYFLALTDAATSGTAVSNPITINTTGKLGNWESNAYAFCRDGNTSIDGGSVGTNSTIAVEWSTDSTTWRAMSTLPTLNPINPSTTSIRFKVTFTRTATTIKSPRFGIARIRFPYVTDIRTRNGVPEVDEPIIRAIETWDQEQFVKEPRALRREANAAKFWTLPLSFFDTSLTRDSMDSKIRETAFVEQRYGSNIGLRYPINSFYYSDRFGIFTRQEFDLRRAQGNIGTNQGEFYTQVW